MADDKGDDAKIFLFIGVVWIVCTIGLSFTSMEMFGVREAWIVGFSFFLLVAAGIWRADSRGKKDSPPEQGTDSASEE
ncbi:MAG: hypothetical protein CXX69_06105 [Candidatus Thalassarchaeum betae]|jgi:hypothetical protein|uniref:Uncharacterized protein n=1 Tax=Candidatus Thalassarchaeum betae TaxID=2599289 RepID=A0A2V3HP69_9ARCH|nr:hypothetical protein [Candidatus Thalassoarchaea betae]PXF25152.1 MAG: hypothetical protein CXX70_08350 [Euryarchaeota archaeon]RTZ95251.1 MAG: hypothetical protein DSY41_02435 [Candidatus Poseidoniales archaeon]PXF20920.1 MAG: hypothetical protein CXX69_06105 [Candidatus Thalassoarchaea betae]HIC50116.1 hypothetical protein [Candidatus Poseidoniales archaeon]